MPQPYTQTTCDHCTLGEAMKDCPSCAFARGLTAPHATSADVFRMYRRLWDDYTPDDVREAAQIDPTRELVDLTQEPLWMIEV